MNLRNDVNPSFKNPLNIGILDGWFDAMENISGEWNGDDPGIKEERAHTAEEAQTLIKKLKALFVELNF